MLVLCAALCRTRSHAVRTADHSVFRGFSLLLPRFRPPSQAQRAAKERDDAAAWMDGANTRKLAKCVAHSLSPSAPPVALVLC